MAEVIFAGSRSTYTRAEEQGVQWLAERAGWKNVYVRRRTDREFDLQLSGAHLIAGSGIYGKFDWWFVRRCLYEWVEMGLLVSRVRRVAAMGQSVVLWEHFETTLAEQRAMLKPRVSKTLVGKFVGVSKRNGAIVKPV